MASSSASGHKTTTTSSTASTTSSKDCVNDISANISGGKSGKLTSGIAVQSPVANARRRPSLEDDNEQGSSGEEWGMEIGDLIIDLDADLEKDEMKEKSGNAKSSDGRNSNNNNSIKGSGTGNAKSPSSSQSSKMNTSSNTGSNKAEGGSSAKTNKGITGNGSSTPNAGKTKSKSKKSSKSSSGSKHSDNSNPANGNSNSKGKPEKDSNQAGTPNTCSSNSDKSKNSDASTQENNSANKSGGKTNKSGRGYKKHSKNNNNTEKKVDGSSTATAGSSVGKDSREKSNKSNKLNKQQNAQQPASTSSAGSHSIASFMAPPSSVMHVATAAGTKAKRSNSPCYTSMLSKFQQNHGNPVTKSSDVTSGSNILGGMGRPPISLSCDTPLMSHATAQFGKHKKTSSIPSSMKYPIHSTASPAGLTQSQLSIAVTPTSTLVIPSTDPLSGHSQTYVVSGGKRDRGAGSVTPTSGGNKKMKLEKAGKPFLNVMPPSNEADISGASKSGNASVVSIPSSALATSAHYVATRDMQTSNTGGNRMSGGLANNSGPYEISAAGDSTQTAISNIKTEVSASGAGPNSSVPPTSTNHAANMTDSAKLGRDESGLHAENEGTGLPPNGSSRAEGVCGDADGTNKKSVGTVTYADAGVSTEPEALGPCEPGTIVHLDGIVWHETESGVLVVNVTWRNRSYVGTLLDATKHDWAPPRIPDADSDVEFRVKSGRPKRQRGGNGGNGSGGDTGRKGRKSAMANNGDEYKNSPSSNKRRSAKMSESDACSGNDGEICTTPSKSAKRARMSTSRGTASSARQNLLRNTTANNTTAKESTSGEGTSGSGSSTCSSPVFMECPYANCKKRYNNNNALKYHEAHAHYGEDVSGAEEGEKSEQDADSPAADSPKDSDNMSTKSPEEMVASESTGSPNNLDGESVQQDTVMDVDSNASAPVQVPFVVTRPMETTIHPAGQYISQPFPVSSASPLQESYNNSTASNNENQDRDYNQSHHSDGHFSNTSSSHAAAKSDQTNESQSSADGVYSMNDLQTSESISLKTHVPSSKANRPYHGGTPTPAYNEVININPNVPPSSIESTIAVDSESAQAVETLLQLQDSHDQLPGLSSYNQTSTGCALPTPSSHTVSTNDPPTSTPIIQSYPPFTKPAVELVHAKSTVVPHSSVTQTPPTSVETPQPSSSLFRGHQVDPAGPTNPTPLPRMSVGISSSANSNSLSITNQYVVGHSGYTSHSHGTVTTNPSQEGGALYTSSGVKMAKGKIVPIPTDPHQTPNTPQSNVPSVTPGSSGSNGKKAKRKKIKGEPGKMPRHSPTNIATPKAGHPSRPTYKDDGTPVRSAIQDPTSTVRVKQEPHIIGGHPQQPPMQFGAGVAPNSVTSYPKFHPADPTSKAGPGQPVVAPPRMTMKHEPGLKVPQPGVPMPGRTAGFTHPNAPQVSRHQPAYDHPHPDLGGSSHDQSHGVVPHMVPTNKNNNNKQLPSSKPSDIGVHATPSRAVNTQHAASPVFPETTEGADRRDGHSGRKSSFGETRPKSHLAVPPGSSHSLPGSRSITPINTPHSSSGLRPSPQVGRDSSTPNKSQTLVLSSQRQPHIKESGSPPPPLDRRASSEASQDPKQNPVVLSQAFALQQHIYGAGLPYPYSFIPPYDMGTAYPAQYMNDPSFQHHYEQVIQHEIRKDQPKEQQKPKEEQEALSHPPGAARSRLSASPSSHSKPGHSKSSPTTSVEERINRESSPPRSQRHHALPPSSQARIDGRSIHGPQGPLASSHTGESRVVPGVSPAPSHGSYPPTPSKPHLMTPNTSGISPHLHGTPPPLSGSRPPRPNSETERVHRREPSIGDRPTMRVTSMTPGRKLAPGIKEGFPDHRSSSPDKAKSGPPPTSVYAAPASLPVQTLQPGQYFPAAYPGQIFDPRNLPYGFAGYPMYPPGTPIYPGAWPSGAPPPTVAGPPERHATPSPHPGNPPREHSSSGSRSPYRDEGARSRSEVRAREGGSYINPKDRSDGYQIRKSVTPDPKSVPARNPPVEANLGSASPPTQRHLHTHHHIHEGFPLLPPQYPYPGPIPAMASAVMAGTEAAAALAPFPKRDIS